MHKKTPYAVGATLMVACSLAIALAAPLTPQTSPTKSLTSPNLKKAVGGFAQATNQPNLPKIMDRKNATGVPSIGKVGEVPVKQMKRRRGRGYPNDPRYPRDPRYPDDPRYPRRPPPGGRYAYIVCESRDYRYTECGAGFYIDRVYLRDEQSRTYCQYGRNWGYDSYRIWVDQGCRAGFDVYGSY